MNYFFTVDPQQGISMYIRKDDLDYFPKGFSLERLDEVIETLELDDWHLQFKDPDGAGINYTEGSSISNIVAIMFRT